MDIGTAVRTCFQKYATFAGRAQRAEFWWFTLFNFIASSVLSLVDGAMFGFGHGMMGEPGIQFLSSIYSLAVFVPSLAVCARRLHDTGRSGWWLLIWLIPLIGWIILIWWFATRGDDGPNEHGADPLGGGYGPSSIPRVPRQ